MHRNGRPHFNTLLLSYNFLSIRDVLSFAINEHDAYSNYTRTFYIVKADDFFGVSDRNMTKEPKKNMKVKNIKVEENGDQGNKRNLKRETSDSHEPVNKKVRAFST